MGGEGLTVEDLKEIKRKQEIVSRLQLSGALDIRGGSFTAHLDSDGNLRKVERNDTLFRV